MKLSFELITSLTFLRHMPESPSLLLSSLLVVPIIQPFEHPSCLGHKQNDPIQKPSFQPDDPTVQQIFQLVSSLSCPDHKHGSPSLLLSSRLVVPIAQLA